MRRTIILPFLFLSLTTLAQNPALIRFSVWTPELGPLVDIAHCGDTRLFAVAQSGQIYVVTDSMQVLARPFLNIDTLVDYSGEKGLLGLAFAPDYGTSGYLYLNYVAPGGPGISIISRWKVSTDPDSVDVASEEIIFSYQQPYVNHNGGDLDFGPDGMLYIPFGDGGDAGDPQGHGQDLSDPLGDMLRIDVSDPDTTYTIPADNPFMTAGPDTLKEIWASGLRNPFRFGFDRLTGDIWIGDVGQYLWEEIDFLPTGMAGANFGWRCYEGFDPFVTAGCQPQSFYRDPVLVKAHASNGGDHCAIIGGRVYRGSLWPHLYGRYFYTDFCAMRIGNLRPDGSGGFLDETSYIPGQSGFSCIAENSDGELFAANLGSGKLYKIKDRCPMDPPLIAQAGNTLSTDTGAIGYQWFFNGDTVPGAIANTFEPGATGDVHVVVDLGDLCVLSSDTLAFIFTAVTGQALPALRLYPDPANDQLNVIWSNAEVRAWRVVDGLGRTVLDGGTGRGSLLLDTRSLRGGSYSLQLLSAEAAVLAARRFTVVH